MLSFKDFICENYDSFLIEAFSAEMKSKMSSKILHEIARKLKDAGISANNVTFEKLSKDQQAKLKRRVKDAEGVGRFVIICHSQNMGAVKELQKYKKLAKEKSVDFSKDPGPDLRQKLRALVDDASYSCYFIDTKFSDCTRIKEKFNFDWDLFDENGQRNYRGDRKILTSVDDVISTGKWDGYVAEIQEMMRDQSYDAFVIKDADGNAYISDLEASRRASRVTNDPLDPIYSYDRKSALYRKHEAEVQQNKNKRSVKDDAKMLIDLINEFDDVRNLFIKSINAVTVNNKKGSEDYYYQAERLITKLEKFKDAVYTFKWYMSDYWNTDTDIHKKVMDDIAKVK